MKFKILLLAVLSGFATAQTTLDKQMKSYTQKVDSIVVSEKSNLKLELDKVDKQFEKGAISKDEQVAQKEALASKYETIINDKIDKEKLLFEEITKNTVRESVFNKPVISSNEDDDYHLKINTAGLNVKIKKSSDSPAQYLKSNTLSVSYAFLNLTQEKGSFNPFESDSEMRIGNSHSVEIQFRKDRQLGNFSSPFFIRYGFAYRTDTYMPKRPQVFVENNSQLYLENFSEGSIKRSKLRNVYLTIPVEFQWYLNPKFKEYKGTSYLDMKKKMLKIGLGAYVGVNTRSIVKVKYYNENDKFRKYDYTLDNGVDAFLFGGKFTLGYGGVNLFLKKDFTPIFNDKAVLPSKNGIQIGIEIANIDF